MSPTDRAPRPRRPLFFWITVGLGSALALHFLASAVVVHRHAGVHGRLGWRPAVTTDRRLAVAAVDPSGPAADRLRTGDLVVAVGGDTRVTPATWEWLLMPVRPGDTYALRVERGGEVLDVALATSRERSPGWMGTPLVRAILFMTLCATGLIVGLLRPQESAARLYSLASLLSAPVLFANPVLTTPLDEGLLTGAWVLVPWIARIHSPLHGAVGYHFALRFPPGVAPGRAWAAFRWVLYAWAGVICAYYNLTTYCIVSDPGLGVRLTWEHPRAWAALEHMDTLLGVAVFGSIPAVILRNHRAAIDPDRRRRTKWVLFGATVGFLPAALVFALRFVDSLLPAAVFVTNRTLFENVAYSFLAVAPVTVAYAIAKHRVFGIEIVVRRGLQHLLARNVLRLALFMPLALLTLGVLQNPDRTVAQVLFQHPGHIALIVAGALSLRFRTSLMLWLDRRFFREAYQREQVLFSLLDDVRSRDSLPDLSRLVSERVAAALHPERLYVVFHSLEGRDFAVQYSSGGDSAGPRLSEDSSIVRLLSSRPRAQEIPKDGPALPEDEREWLRHLGVRLGVPVHAGEGRLVGLMLLGEKKSEEAYTREDCQFLESVAAQMGIVYENTALRARVEREETMRRQVLARLERDRVNVVKECPRCGTCYDSSEERCPRDDGELVMNLPVERTIEGKYRLERALGRGGMGAVYEATDLRLARQVAVKVMSGRTLGAPGALRRFEREAQASARLRHPNIITIHDYGTLAPEGAYIVMERLLGTTLRAEIDRLGAIPPEEAAEYLRQILDGIHEAHAAGVIHRDLKPGNVFLTGDTQEARVVKILDFGLAKLKMGDRADPQSLTLPGTVLGTLAYMSPEQLSGHPVDERSDVFALGVLAAETLTGRHPFAARSTSAMVAAILQAPYHLPGESEEVRCLDEVLQRCLAKSRDERFASIADLRDALIPAVRRCPPFPAAPRSAWDRDTAVF